MAAATMASAIAPVCAQEPCAVDLDSGTEGPYETVDHEYAHVLLNRTLDAQRLWVAEGLAEVFACREASVDEVRLGQPAPDHLRRLGREKPLPLAQLLRVEPSSSLYNEGDQRGRPPRRRGRTAPSSR